MLAVVRTLHHRAQTIPSNASLKMEEQQKVDKALELNGYPRKMINRFSQLRQTSDVPHSLQLLTPPMFQSLMSKAPQRPLDVSLPH